MDTKQKLEDFIQISADAAHHFSFPQSVPKDPNALALSKWYAKEVQTATEQISALEDTHNFHTTCSCGCSACCQQLIAVSKPEIIMLNYALSQMDDKTAQKIKETIIKQCEILSQNGFSKDSIPQFPSSASAEENLKTKYFSLHLPCPFLSEDNACLIYHIRPSLCWSYRNYGDPVSCQNSHNVDTTILFEDWEAAVVQRLFAAKKPSKKGPALMILQFALLPTL